MNYTKRTRYSFSVLVDILESIVRVMAIGTGGGAIPPPQYVANPKNLRL